MVKTFWKYKNIPWLGMSGNIRIYHDLDFLEI